MMRKAPLLALFSLLLAIGAPAHGEWVNAKDRADEWSSIERQRPFDDPSPPEKTVAGASKSSNDVQRAVGAGPNEPVDRKIVLAQAKLPSLKETNLLAADEGGQALVVPNDEWFKPISGKENVFAVVGAGQEAVYAFKDEKPATFSKFSVLIVGQSNCNPKQIEVLAADDSPTGEFRSLGILNTVNAKLVKIPYQELGFAKTKAKYVKIKIRADWGGGWVSLGQIRLLGTLAE